MLIGSGAAGRLLGCDSRQCLIIDERKSVEHAGRDRQVAICSVQDYAAIFTTGAYARGALGGLPKRALDITISGIALIVLAPILLVTAGLIRVLIGKSAFVANEWIGLRGKRFTSLQFCCTAGACGHTSSPLLWRNEEHSWAQSLAGALHISGLDKLPLLANVLRGDMSLIGPRPITADELLRYCKLMPEYFTARPGLTGLWRHSRALNFRLPATQIALDRYYIRYWSVWLDVGLVIKALSAIA